MISIFCSERYAKRNRGHTAGWREPDCWAYKLAWPCQPGFYIDIDAYAQSSASFRVAFYLVDWSLDYAAQSLTETTTREYTNISRLSKISDLVFVFENEVHKPSLPEMPSFASLANIYWVMPGTVDAFRDRIIQWPYHIWRVRDIYEYDIPDHLLRLDPYSIKPYYFDAMLGTRKGPRPFVHDWIGKNTLHDKILASIGPMPGEKMPHNMLTDPSFFVDPDWKPVDYCDYLQLNQHVKVDDRIAQLPSLIPFHLYSKTAYSIVCETGFANGTHMLTEKTAKVLIGRRLFVIFAGAGYLRYLRELGFKTFDHVIDERYDTVEDDLTRWKMAFEQVRHLCGLDQSRVLDIIRPVVDHNYRRAMMTDLTQEPIQKIQDLVGLHAKTKI